MANSDIIQTIKQKVSIESVLEEYGFHLERHGGRGLFKLKEHDSFIVDPIAQRFWWNSRGAQGTVIDMVMALDNCDQKRAISILNKKAINPSRANFTPLPAPQHASPPKKEFHLPEVARDKWPRIYAYLIKTRGIDKSVVKWLHNNKLIYPDNRGNLVYLGKGYDGGVEYAAARGTHPDKRYCHVIGGNYDARCGFNHVQTNCKKLFVCEAAIDVFSVMSLLVRNGKDFTQYAYLSLESCHEAPLLYHLERQPQIEKIYLAQDADAAGMQSRVKCRALLEKAGWKGKAIDWIPRQGKDWNDTLKYELSQEVKIMLEEQAVHVEVSAVRDIGQMLFSVLRQIVAIGQWHSQQPNHGMQSIKQLNAQNRELKEVEIDNSTVKEVKRQLRGYAVDFSIFKDTDEKLHLWFKGQDIDRVHRAIGNCVENLVKSAEQTKEPASIETSTDSKESVRETTSVGSEHAIAIEEISKQATQSAAELNKGQAAPQPIRQQELVRE